jgi:hypothetical protein
VKGVHLTYQLEFVRGHAVLPDFTGSSTGRFMNVNALRTLERPIGVSSTVGTIVICSRQFGQCRSPVGSSDGSETGAAIFKHAMVSSLKSPVAGSGDSASARIATAC